MKDDLTGADFEETICERILMLLDDVREDDAGTALAERADALLIDLAEASPPPCVVCGKRTSRRAVPKCPWCGRVLCYKCACPGRCFAPLVPGPGKEKK